MPRIVCLGEAMLEIAGSGESWSLAYGGDTLNTAIHLARLGHDVSYLTALGTDPFSARLCQQWRDEGLDVSLVQTHPTRNVGIYAISTDAHGERTFTYWRDNSAARAMFELPGMARATRQAERADLLCFSLISLAVLPTQGREAVLALAAAVREAGGQVAFDGNYRPRLWSDAMEASRWRDAAMALATFGLPTLEDEVALGLPPDPAAVAAHWTAAGCAETIVKLGAAGALLPDGRVIAPEVGLAPVDTSGAGDAFNAGYLSARLGGADLAAAAHSGHALAGWTIMRRGAIPPRDP